MPLFIRGRSSLIYVMIPDFTQENGEVLFNEPVARDIYRMRLHAPPIAGAIRPAQFIQIRTDPGPFPFLRRPFSALQVDRQAGWVDILYDAIGPGTRKMAAAGPGQPFGLVGPLGLPFSPPVTDRLLLVAGGVGLVVWLIASLVT